MSYSVRCVRIRNLRRPVDIHMTLMCMIQRYSAGISTGPRLSCGRNNLVSKVKPIFAKDSVCAYHRVSLYIDTHSDLYEWRRF